MIIRISAFIAVTLATLVLSTSIAIGHTVRPAVVTIETNSQGSAAITVRMNAEILLARIGPEYSDTNDAPNAEEYDRYRAMGSAELRQKLISITEVVPSHAL